MIDISFDIKLIDPYFDIIKFTYRQSTALDTHIACEPVLTESTSDRFASIRCEHSYPRVAAPVLSSDYDKLVHYFVSTIR